VAKKTLRIGSLTRSQWANRSWLLEPVAVLQNQAEFPQTVFQTVADKDASNVEEAGKTGALSFFFHYGENSGDSVHAEPHFGTSSH